MPRRPSPPHQPKTYKLTFKSLFTLPFRICNPPPAVGKVRSCGVTPIFDVSLEDVLEKKHLPPLGLKDFEEWLLYVELSPENLYFILWLREYRVKYNRYKFLRKERGADWKHQSSSDLAWFYARCKQTFLTPNSAYELNLPSEILAPFHATDGSPHPDPSVFDTVEIQVWDMLRESLRRFVTAQFNNVGNNRVLCGMIAGIFSCLLGALFPIIYNFAQGQSRWARLSAFPGLWLGLTLLVSSLNGICLGIYIFGDLRQLKKFELSRPPISKPQLLHTVRQSPASPTGPILPLSHLPGVLPPPPIYSPSRLRNNGSSSTLSLGHQSSSDLSFTDSDNVIHISPAYYDPDPIEGPAVTPISPDCPSISKPFSHFDDEDEEEQVFVPTAAFIHAYEHSSDDGAVAFEDVEKKTSQAHQSVSAFDFDALPPKPAHPKASKPVSYAKPVIMGPNPHVFVIEPEVQPLPNSIFSLKGFLLRLQERCSENKWLVFTSNGNGDSPNPSEEKITSHSSRTSREKVPHENLIRKQFKMVKAVPAFGSPLTRVLNPVVVRGQWEIVVRSIVIALLITWIVLGSILAIPVPRHKT